MNLFSPVGILGILLVLLLWKTFEVVAAYHNNYIVLFEYKFLPFADRICDKILEKCGLLSLNRHRQHKI